MLQQDLPQAAEVYAAQQRREIGAAVSAVRRQWSRMGEDFDATYLRIESAVLAIMDVAQARIAGGALTYIPAVLAQTGQRVRPLEYPVTAAALVGTAGDGLGTDTLAYQAVITAKSAVNQGAKASLALDRGGQFLTTAVGTLLSDTGRTAEKMAGHSRQVTTWTRMLNPPSCGRCVILAGQVSHTQDAFLRHPKCDCRNVPSSESVADDVRVDARTYLDSLSDDELARSLGSKANAQAFRDGADMNQLVNAYRRGGDVSTAQVFSRSVKYTTEATTKRGAFGRAARAAGRDPQRTPRLMPESIYQIATDRADAQRLLRAYGWVR